MSAYGRVTRSHLGVDLVRLLSAQGDRIFTIDRARELAPQVGLKGSYLPEALYHLRRDGWIVSLRRGLYALSSSVPGVNPVHEFEIAMALTEPAAISHWSALSFHGLTEQIPNTVFVLTTIGSSVPRNRSASADDPRGVYHTGDLAYHFIKVMPDRFFGLKKYWIGESQVTVTDPERTLLDGLTRPRYCGDFAGVLQAFETHGAALDLERIVAYALQLDAVTVKRLGWVLERLDITSPELDRLAEYPIKGYRQLDPSGPRAGPLNRHWMVRENLPGWTSS